MNYVKSEVFLFLYSVKIISFLPSVYNDSFTCMKYERTPLTILTTGMIQQLRHPFFRHFRLVGSAFLLHHVLANQWVVVIILLVFSANENMFVEHTENMMMDIFLEFHAVA